MAIQPEKKDLPPPRNPRPNTFANSSNWWFLVAVAIVLLFLWFSSGNGARSEISYGMFCLELERNNVAEAQVRVSRRRRAAVGRHPVGQQPRHFVVHAAACAAEAFVDGADGGGHRPGARHCPGAQCG